MILALLITIALSLFGLADATFLSYKELSGQTPPCINHWLFDCGKVLESSWAYIGPIPLSVLGMGYYLTVFSLAIAMFLFPTKRKILSLPLLLLTGSGLLFSGFLTYLQVAVIHALCFFCLISATISILLFISAFITRFLLKRHD